jgi:hypothetical protein
LEGEPDSSEALSFQRTGATYLTMSSEGAYESPPVLDEDENLSEVNVHHANDVIHSSPFYSLTSNFSMKTALARPEKSQPHRARAPRRKQFTEDQRSLASKAKSPGSLQALDQQVRVRHFFSQSSSYYVSVKGSIQPQGRFSEARSRLVKDFSGVIRWVGIVLVLFLKLNF